MALNDLGEQISERLASMPRFNLPAYADSEDRKELAAKLAEHRTIRTGRDCWEEIFKCQSFSAWSKIGAALAIGRDYGLRATGANAPMGRRYTWAFSAWCKRHGFGNMPPSTRSWCLALHEHLPAITAWRDGLPERERKRLVNPQSCVKRWQLSQAHGNGRCPQDWKREAIHAWRRFCFCVAALPESEAQAMWSMVKAAANVAA